MTVRGVAISAVRGKSRVQASKACGAVSLRGQHISCMPGVSIEECALQFIDWMTSTIKDLGATLLLVTHDRAFMEDCCTSILELDSGRGYVHNVGGRGSYQQFRERRAERRAAQAAAAADAKVCVIVLLG